MTVLDTPLGKVILAKAPPWSKRKTMVIKKYPARLSNPTAPQKAVQRAFATTAISQNWGQPREVGNANIARALSKGEGGFGGETREQRRQRTHAISQARWQGA